jgi:[citrate (pro-3S)-lyase] ligase
MYSLKQLWLKEPKVYQQWAALMDEAGLNKEEIDYAVGIYQDNKLVATGAYYRNILKCLVVCQKFQSENLLTEVIQHLISRLAEEGQHHYFLYSKPANEAIFRSLGFKKITETAEIIFMELGLPNFASYLSMLSREKKAGVASGIVMNANPFTKGHQYLVEEAAKQSEQVYVFVLSENRSEFSTIDRMEMVKQGVAHLPNVTVFPTNDYLVSSATFPSYFLKDNAIESVSKLQAELDATLFKNKIAPSLNIRTRFVGDEPYSKVTEIYNRAMQEVFGNSLDLIILPRLSVAGEIISATKVRKAIKEHDDDCLSKFLPETTYHYIKKMRGEPL